MFSFWKVPLDDRWCAWKHLDCAQCQFWKTKTLHVNDDCPFRGVVAFQPNIPRKQSLPNIIPCYDRSRQTFPCQSCRIHLTENFPISQASSSIFKMQICWIVRMYPEEVWIGPFDQIIIIYFASPLQSFSPPFHGSPFIPASCFQHVGGQCPIQFFQIVIVRSWAQSCCLTRFWFAFSEAKT